MLSARTATTAIEIAMMAGCCEARASRNPVPASRPTPQPVAAAPAAGASSSLPRSERATASSRSGFGLGLAGARVLDLKTAALVQVGVLVAIGSPEVCLEWSATRALEASATEDEIAEVLLAICPGSRTGRVVTAVPGTADAFGYDIEAALEDPDDR